VNKYDYLSSPKGKRYGHQEQRRAAAIPGTVQETRLQAKIENAQVGKRTTWDRIYKNISGFGQIKSALIVYRMVTGHLDCLFVPGSRIS
jgi:hypothetical protein